MEPARITTEKQLATMEKKLAAIYKRADKEVGEKLKEYLKSLEPQEKALKEAIAAATTPEEKRKAEKAYESFMKEKTIYNQHYQNLSKQIAGQISKVNQTAADYVNGRMPSVYALNYNDAGNEVAGQVKGYSFELVDPATVRSLATKDETLLPYKVVDGKKDVRWNTNAVNSEILQGILQGESIPDMSKRLTHVTEMNLSSAIRNARTATTSAENRGRMDSYRHAEEMGIKIVKVWMATSDQRTREEHLELDGQEREIDEPFENSIGLIMYPGDPNADPANVYNCRCTLVTKVLGFERAALKEPEWEIQGEEVETPVQKVQFTVIQGKDISDTWTRRPDQFDFEIEDVINAQGFDGVPRVVSPEEFDEFVKQANGGNGFIAQRNYSAPDQETLDAYRDQLYNGKWYVDCSTGGSQYGQGMYCAADYSGKLSDGIVDEMEHYRKLGAKRTENEAWESRLNTLTFDELMNTPYASSEEITKEEFDVFKRLKTENITGYKLPASEKEIWENMLENGHMRDMNMALNELSDNFTDNFKGFSYTETLTLDPSARIITYNDLVDLKLNSRKYIEERLKELQIDENEMNIIRRELTLGTKEQRDAARIYEKEHPDAYQKVLDKYIEKAEDIYDEAVEKHEALRQMDDGAFASLLGYDAINAEKHGESGSYTVILNRTKVIIKGEK